jgi:hypothetical protein
MPDDLKSKLDAHFQEIVERLRLKAPDDTEELLRVIAAREGIRAMEGVPQSSQLPFLYYDSVIEAILEWFKRRKNEPADEEEIVKGVLDGGLQLHSPRRELNTRDSLRFQTRNARHGKLKRVGKKILPK